MPVGSQTMDMLGVAVDNYEKHHLDVLVILGGNGTQKNAYKLMKQGLNIITLPKTIDNDVWGTDVTFGFDTAMSIAAEAIDRLHTTAESHHRIIVVEIMGHKAGWLALGAGIAGGADVILIPEIPYDIVSVADAVLRRSRAGKRFSIIAMAEGALSIEERAIIEDGKKKQRKVLESESASARLAPKLQEITGLQARVTALGHLQRGGTPTATDRLLATRLGTACAELIEEKESGIMVAIKRHKCKPVSLEKVAGRLKTVRPDHPWVHSARLVGTSFGD
jgi:6-phosphofructokinase 1